MATTLLLICIAPTASSREARFPGPAEPLDEAGKRGAARHGLPVRFRAAAFASPARAAAETARAMGLAALPEPALADLDHGRWTGLSFAQIDAAEPGALGAWIADPAQGTPGGETLQEARRRVGEWMDRIAANEAPLYAVTHPMIVRAALAHALDLPVHATLAIDVAPLSQTVLSFNGRWRLQSLGLPGGLAGGGAPG